MPAMDSSRFLFCLFPVLFLMINQALGQNCIDEKGNYTTNSTYQTYLNRLLSSLPSNENGNGYGFYSASYRLNSSNEHIYAIGLCRGDATAEDCRSCLNNSRYDLPQLCPNRKEAFGSYEKCMLRYSNRSIYGVMEIEPSPYYWNINNISSSELDGFNEELWKLLDSIRSEAAAGGSLRKFAFGNTSAPTFQTIFALAQCTPDISEQMCRDCLVGTLSRISNFYGQAGGGVNRPSCYFRFDVYPFYDPTNVRQLPSPLSQGSNSSKSQIVIIIIVPIIASLVLVMFMGICLRVRKAKKMLHSNLIPGKRSQDKFFNMTIASTSWEDSSTITNIDESGINSELPFFELSTIVKATNNFASNKKLGTGGFGSVYKGVLDNGKGIAVKRLAKNSSQGIGEFKNEVVLLSKLQHRNLVRIMGCCVQDEEKMLIYEYLPNKSLDFFIFAKEAFLDWTRRFEIICGIARGILYLHQDSRLRIIHRDLKASNVLLDSAMNPKISDFGMARIFGAEQIKANTNRVVGTYGYMSPEYAMEGLFSVKSDVYSFGVLLLEIVTGRKNTDYYDDSPYSNLVGHVWDLWKENRALEIIDSSLGESYHVNEVLRCIHIALLCVQEQANDRPLMSAAVSMLGNDAAIPSPKQPGFLLKRSYHTSGDPSTNTEGAYTVNDMTYTEVEGR